jgi:hypothetical protein
MIAGFGYVAGAIWGVVEGLDYFVNQDPVNWMFLLPLIGGLFIAMINMIALFLKKP